MMRRYLTGLAAAAFCAALSAQAIVPQEGESFEISFPGDQFTPDSEPVLEADLAATSAGWRAFTGELGTDWRALYWNAAAGLPRLAGGPPIAVLGAGTHSTEEVAARSREFIGRISDLIRMTPDQFQFEDLRVFGDRAFVFFDQYHEGLPVFTGQLKLLYYRGGVNAIEPSVYPDIRVGTTPGLSEAQGAESARSGMPWDPEADTIDAVRLGVLPMVWDTDTGYFLVYQVRFRTAAPPGDWVAYVDAHDGEVYWRENYVSYYTITGSSRGDVQPRRADDAFEDLPMIEQKIGADGNEVFTDEVGDFEVEVTNNEYYTVTDYNEGRWVRVWDNIDGEYSQLTTLAAPYDPAIFYWDNSNTYPPERNCFYHANVVHAWLKHVDPDWTANDYPINCRVNLDCTCNGYWQGGTINFCSEGGGCNNTGNIADVIYHEYHHWVTYRTYNLFPPPNHTGLNEGFSDYCAMTITNDQCMGPSFHQSNPDGCLRYGMNYRQYPAPECGGEEHCMGEITMGALWKTRRNLIEKYGPDAAHQTDLLFREAMLSRPNSIQLFLSYLLMANDDNGNIADGSPDYWEICDAWAAHNVMCPVITIYIDFVHTPLADTENTVDPILVTSEILPIGGAGLIIEDSTRVFYSFDGETYVSAPMSNVGGDTFEGYIDPSASRLVDYYLRSVTTTGLVGTEPIRAPEVHTHRFLIGGVTQALADDLEEDLGWTIGAPDDDATEGLWERVDPGGKQYNGEWVQPENDHTPGDGALCFVTDGRGGYYTNYDVDAGQTSVISPPLDLTSFGDGYIDFYAFLANFGATADDSLMLYVSPDGIDWTMLWEIHGEGWNDPDYIYQKVYFRRAQYGGSATAQFKIVAEDNENNTIAEAAVDDFAIYVTSAGAAGDDRPPAQAFWAAPASPSPFSRATAIRFQIPTRQHVQLRIYDVGGRLVRSLHDESLEGGVHTVQWDGRTDRDLPASSGVYYYDLTTGGQKVTRKVILTR